MLDGARAQLERVKVELRWDPGIEAFRAFDPATGEIVEGPYMDLTEGDGPRSREGLGADPIDAGEAGIDRTDPANPKPKIDAVIPAYLTKLKPAPRIDE